MIFHGLHENLSFFASEYPTILRPTKTKNPEVEMRNALNLVENTLGFTPEAQKPYMLRQLLETGLKNLSAPTLEKLSEESSD